MRVLLHPGFHEIHRLILVPVGDVFADDFDVRPFLEELLSPTGAAGIGMEIPRRAVEHHHFGVRGDLFERKPGVHGGLFIGVGIHRRGAGNALDAGVAGNRHQARFNGFDGVRPLGFAIIRLDDDGVEFAGDGIFDQAVFGIVRGLAIEDAQIDIGIFGRFSLDGIGQPGGEGVGLGPGNERHAIGLGIWAGGGGVGSAAVKADGRGDGEKCN